MVVNLESTLEDLMVAERQQENHRPGQFYINVRATVGMYLHSRSMLRTLEALLLLLLLSLVVPVREPGGGAVRSPDD